MSVTGDAVIKRKGEWVQPKIGEQIRTIDTIETDKNSRLVARFADGTEVTIGANSSVNVRDFVAEGENQKADLSFTKGAFKVVTGKIGKIAPQNFSLRTSTATIGVRGTTIHGIIGSTGDKIMCASGTINVKGSSGNTVEVEAGKASNISPSGVAGAAYEANFADFPLYNPWTENPLYIAFIVLAVIFIAVDAAIILYIVRVRARRKKA
jgi:ferric-dicitrate binding protein FerR (iron transport regulator)